LMELLPENHEIKAKIVKPDIALPE
jgi:hypothetical protein